MRARSTRRSCSSCFSPSPPRAPMPPPWRDRWLHCRVSRGSRYLSRASSTWVRASRLRARWSKISRIRPLRSMTGRPVAFSRFLTWLAERSSSKISRPAPSSRASARDLLEPCRRRCRSPDRAPGAPGPRGPTTSTPGALGQLRQLVQMLLHDEARPARQDQTDQERPARLPRVLVSSRLYNSFGSG